MALTSIIAAETGSRTAGRIGWLLLAYYIWIPPINLWALLARVESPLPAPVLELAIFAITAAMMAVARNSFRIFRIDRLSFALFLIFGTFLRIPRPSNMAAGIDPTYYAFGLVALVLLVVILRSRGEPNRWAPVDWRWLGIGLLSG